MLNGFLSFIALVDSMFDSFVDGEFFGLLGFNNSVDRIFVISCFVCMFDRIFEFNLFLIEFFDSTSRIFEYVLLDDFFDGIFNGIFAYGLTFYNSTEQGNQRF
jgi:hypothetical protein